MLKFNPLERLTAEEIRDHDWTNEKISTYTTKNPTIKISKFLNNVLNK